MRELTPEQRAERALARIFGRQDGHSPAAIKAIADEIRDVIRKIANGK